MRASPTLAVTVNVRARVLGACSIVPRSRVWMLAAGGGVLLRGEGSAVWGVAGWRRWLRTARFGGGRRAMVGVVGEEGCWLAMAGWGVWIEWRAGLR